MSLKTAVIALAVAGVATLGGATSASAVPIMLQFNVAALGNFTANTGDVTTATTITNGAPTVVGAIQQNNIGLVAGQTVTLAPNPMGVTVGSAFTKSFTAGGQHVRRDTHGYVGYSDGERAWHPGGWHHHLHRGRRVCCFRSHGGLLVGGLHPERGSGHADQRVVQQLHHSASASGSGTDLDGAARHGHARRGYRASAPPVTPLPSGESKARSPQVIALFSL